MIPAHTAPIVMVSKAASDSIGQAHMENDGTIILDIRETSPSGQIVERRIAYGRKNPHYDELLQRLGGLTPGQIKPAPPLQPWKSPRS